MSARKTGQLEENEFRSIGKKHIGWSEVTRFVLPRERDPTWITERQLNTLSDGIIRLPYNCRARVSQECWRNIFTLRRTGTDLENVVDIPFPPCSRNRVNINQNCGKISRKFHPTGLPTSLPHRVETLCRRI